MGAASRVAEAAGFRRYAAGSRVAEAAGFRRYAAGDPGGMDHDDERPDDDREPPGGSGTVGDSSTLERQAGSLARDAEQDPALGRDRSGGTGAHDEPERTERPDR